MYVCMYVKSGSKIEKSRFNVIKYTVFLVMLANFRHDRIFNILNKLKNKLLKLN